VFIKQWHPVERASAWLEIQVHLFSTYIVIKIAARHIVRAAIINLPQPALAIYFVRQCDTAGVVGRRNIK